MRYISFAILSLATASTAFAIPVPEQVSEPSILGLVAVTAAALFFARRK